MNQYIADSEIFAKAYLSPQCNSAINFVFVVFAFIAVIKDRKFLHFPKRITLVNLLLKVLKRK
jgi:hypothetical protein